MVADPGLGLLDGEEDEGGVVGAVVGLAEGREVLVAGLANLRRDLVLEAGQATQDEPAVAGPE